MDRSIDTDPRYDERAEERNENTRVRDEGPDRNEIAQLRQVMDPVLKKGPSITEFCDRLREAGVIAIPSLQKTGRLNGMSYDFNGTRYRGSDLGRGYTATGLQKQGVRYDPRTDDARLKEIATRHKDDSVRRFQKPIDLRERSTRAREYDNLASIERKALHEIGRFRAVFAEDFVSIFYKGTQDLWVADRQHLSQQKLIETQSFVIATHDREHRTLTRTVQVVTLTKKGRDLLRRFDRENGKSGQLLWAGFVKPREIVHDAAIYRMFQKEAEQIAKDGGKVRRVVLDFELKRKAFAPLAKARSISKKEYKTRQVEVARELGLKIVGGKIRLPDLRIEYDNAAGERTKVDLELATEHYRGDHMAIKGSAGFKIYADARSLPPGGSYGRSSVLDDHEMEIFSF